MDLSKLGLKPFHRYYVVAGAPVKASSPPDGGKEITKDEYEALVSARNDSPAVNGVGSVLGRAGNPDANSMVVFDTTGEAPKQSGSVVLADESAGIKDTYGPANFQNVLQHLDGLVSESTGISTLQLDEARGYVMEIMTTLKIYPEFEGILVDKDVHNVMVFVQTSMNLASADFVVKKQKKETAAQKKAAKGYGGMTFEMITFDAPVESKKPGKAIAPTSMNFDLGDLSSMNFDSITPTERKK